MAQPRQRKSPAQRTGEIPPDVIDCDSSSWEKSFGRDDAANPNGDADSSREGESNLTTEASTPKPQYVPAPTPNALDKFLATYGSFSGNTFTADQGLKILQWSSWAISYAAQSKRSALSLSLRDFYNDMSFTRYVLRFYGLFQSLEGYRSGSWAGGDWDNPRIAKIAKYLMAGSMILYYPLEYVAYAGWKMPKLVRVNANKISAVSCCFWTAYIVGDFWASCLKLKELKEKLLDLRETLVGKKTNDDKDAVAALVTEERTQLNKIRQIKLQLLRCLLFILPAINWSLPNWDTNPLLGELSLNGLMLAEAYTSVYQSLRSMMQS